MNFLKMDLSANLSFNVYWRENSQVQESAVCIYQGEFREQRITPHGKKSSCGNLELRLLFCLVPAFQ